uniref:cholecystokinin-like n=1 Tax=Oncorhynchus gorbuscha TaxID=8017 RepID=UPI001EAF15E8|nr:cholecystokinin-like [Oncorhynchus gorbuscha]
MNAGICVCVLLAAFSGSSLGRPSHSQDEDKPEPPQLDSVMSPQHTRHTRSAPSSGQLIPFSKPAEDEAEDPRTSLRELLGRLISRKGSVQRSSSLSSRASGPGPSHKIKDRDYLGWMDFGRRSAEELVSEQQSQCCVGTSMEKHHETEDKIFPICVGTSMEKHHETEDKIFPM